MKDKILEILLSIRPENDFKNSINFQFDGLLDSFDMIILVSTIEKVFSIKVPGECIVPSNFKSLDVIVSLVSDLSS